MKPPEGYVGIRVKNTEVWAWGGAADWVERTLETQGSLHQWASGAEGARRLEGRGPVFDVPAPVSGPEGRDRWAVRHFFRGGAMASILDDRYVQEFLGLPRPLAELRCSVTVRQRGISTPAVVAGVVYPAGLFYRGDLVTELIPNGHDLRTLLFDEDIPPAWAKLAAPSLEAAGHLVRRMEREGIYHPDLNAANILVTQDDDAPEGVQLHVLDLDRCQGRPQGAPAPRGPMRDRLERSLRKLESSSPLSLEQDLWETLHRAYEDSA